VDAWAEAQFDRLAPSRARIAHQFGRAALRGSVEHADWLAKVFGWYARDQVAPAGGGFVAQQTVVVIHE
jgi:hypothetical protein